MTTSVLLIGAGRFAQEVTDIAEDAGLVVVGWIEGLDPGRANHTLVPPIYWVDSVARLPPELDLVPAIGSVKRLALVRTLEAAGRRLRTLVHPSAVVARSAVLETGAVIFPGVVIGAQSRIGAGTIVNRGALVGHHTVIGPDGFVGPGANVAGGVRVGKGVTIGMGALVRDDRTIGDDAIVGMGAVVVADVAARSTVFGNPARERPR